MKNIKYREDGTPVIIVPFKMRYLGRKQTIEAPETLALTKLIYGFPESWQEQREAFGMA